MLSFLGIRARTTHAVKVSSLSLDVRINAGSESFTLRPLPGSYRYIQKIYSPAYNTDKVIL